MYLESVRLLEFRNYERLTLAPSPKLNVLIGENAAGKTNVLEALFLCALGRSHRTRHDGELIRYGKNNASVSLELKKRSGSHSICCRLDSELGKELKADGKPLSRSGELLGLLHVVMFSPEDLKLIKQGPSERRRYIDMGLSQLKPSYYYCLQQYNQGLRQRNALLKTGRAHKDTLAPWDEQLSRLGGRISCLRQEFIKAHSKEAEKLHKSLSGGRETLYVKYLPSIKEHGADYEAALKEAFALNLERDKAIGSTSAGPHRDDVLLELDGRDVRAFGSQGQQRTAALSLKLSELALIKSLTKDTPVLLLDDVLSELDCFRQQQLIELLKDTQVFLTATELFGLRGLDMAVYKVKDGVLSPCGSNQA